jgi:hypothetical protein
METLVVLGLFSVVLGVGMDIYLLSGRTSRKALVMERVQADARFAVEAMTREVRTGDLDYDYYAGRGTPLALPDDELAVVSSDLTKIRFHRSSVANESACADAQSRPCLLVTVGANPPEAITPRGVRVMTAMFYVSPAVDPFIFSPGAGYASDTQPHVTIVLGLESAGGRQGEQASVSLQTTAASRAYRR